MVRKKMGEGKRRESRGQGASEVSGGKMGKEHAGFCKSCELGKRAGKSHYQPRLADTRPLSGHIREKGGKG